MIKGKLNVTPIETAKPDRSVADAIVTGNKALLEAIKSITVQAPEIQVVHHEGKSVQIPMKPKKWTFTVERDENNLLTRIVAESE